MRRRRTAVFGAGATALTAGLAAIAAAAGPAAVPVARAAASGQPAVRPAAVRPVSIGIAPGVHRLTSLKTSGDGPPTTAECQQQYGIDCFTPDQLRAAYNEGPLFKRGITGQGQTIVIVDSYGSPTIQSDLKTFDSQLGYPAPPSFKIIAPAGKIPPWDPNGDDAGWAGETTLDVEYAHALAPGANILLVETPTAETEGVTGFPEIVKAENYVIDHHLGDVISQSFDATEETFTGLDQLAPLRSAYINAYKHGVSVLAASGDSGATNADLAGTGYYTSAVTGWPSTDPLVTAIGGTELHQNSHGGYTSTVWNDTYNKTVQEDWTGTDGPSPLSTGGGISAFFSRPSYQNGVAHVTGPARGIPDISLSGACDGAVATYESYPGQAGSWGLICGTSEATPEFASIVALADQVAGHPIGLVNPALYRLSAQHAPGITDVTSGNNTTAFTQDGVLNTVRGYDARRGYDLASGVGTVNAASLVYELAHR
ncbi:MAG: S53 family peptidase [Nocardiopsaceae bacterium]|nr:S53 family peptidase [Nocardiopsaceae bacterium]